MQSRSARKLGAAALAISLLMTKHGLAQEPNRVISSVQTAAIPSQLIVKLEKGSSLDSVIAGFAKKKIKVSVIYYLAGLHTALLRLAQPDPELEHTQMALAAVSEVEGIDTAEPNLVFRLAAIDDPLVPKMWHLSQVRALDAIDLPRASAGTSNPVVVGVIDSGVQLDHEDIAPSLWSDPKTGSHGWNFINDNTDVNPPSNDEMHGTHVAGTIAAAANHIGGVGIDPRARIMVLRACAGDLCDTFSAIRAIQYAIDHDAKILNISWGGEVNSTLLREAIDDAGQHKILCVVAAGNGDKSHIGYDIDVKPFYPASFALPNLIAVAAVDQDGHLASFSNFGHISVPIAAPGSRILGPVPSLRKDTYRNLDGTSMAAPIISGIAALIYERHPSLNPEEVKKIILSAGAGVPSLQDKISSGREVDVLAAVRLSDRTVTTAAALPSDVSGSFAAVAQAEIAKELAEAKQLAYPVGIRGPAAGPKTGVVPVISERVVPTPLRALPPPGAGLALPDNVIFNGKGDRVSDADKQEPGAPEKEFAYVVKLRDGLASAEFDKNLDGVKIIHVSHSNTSPQIYLIKIKTNLDSENILAKIKAIPGVVSAELDAEYRLQMKSVRSEEEGLNLAQRM